MEKLVHKMEKLGFGLDDDSATCDQKQINPRESLLLLAQRYIKDLYHACECRNANCRLPSCQRMKRVVQHAKSCKMKTHGCPICRQLNTLCLYHATRCQEAKCPVIYCSSSRKRWKHGQVPQWLQQILKKNRRIATMQNHEKSAAVFQTSPGNASSSNQPSPGAQPHSNTGLMASPSAQQRLLAILKSDPELMTAFIKHTTVKQTTVEQQQHRQVKIVKPFMYAVPNRMRNIRDVACWEGSGYAQNPQPHPNPQTQPYP